MSRNLVFVDSNNNVEALGRFRTDRKLYLDHQQRDIGAPVPCYSTTDNPSVVRANMQAMIVDRQLYDGGDGWYTHMHSWMTGSRRPTSQTGTGARILIDPSKLVQMGYVQQNQVINPTTIVYQSVLSAGDSANMRQAELAASPPQAYPQQNPGVPSIRG